jgi:ABC-2 type transport system ATP-binding protein
VLGPNGAGKTTLIRMLLGLTRATAGEMRLLGRPVPEQRAEALARVGAIVEEPRFHGHLTGHENLQTNAAARGGGAAARITGALERVGLTERAHDRVKTYSMGMRQRLGIARCLLADPALLILDEPMNGLDPAGILEFRVLIRSFVDEGRTVFLSSHLLDEVERTCDMVAIVDRGRIVRQGGIAEIAGADGSAVVLECDDPAAARALLTGLGAVETVGDCDDALHIVLRPGADVAELNRALVAAGIGVRRLAPGRISLEERFLELTSSIGDDA